MFSFNKKYFFSSIAFLAIAFLALHAEDPVVIEREASWTYDDTNTSYTNAPSDLKYYKFYDVMPDEVTIPITVQQDLSSMDGKSLVVGYGIADPKGQDCRVFKSFETGLANDVTVCLPWWRVEREYQRTTNSIIDAHNVLCSLPTPKPPLTVHVCKTWGTSESLSTDGGKTTCTSYYDRLKDVDCWNTPYQDRCFVDNCSNYVRENCDHNGSEMGDVTSLIGIEMVDDDYHETDTKINLVSYQFTCPSGVFMPHSNCEEEISVLMFPYTCTPPTGTVDGDDGVYIYCDEDKPQYDAGGDIIGFLGTCPNGTEVMCNVNSFSNTNKQCIDPIVADINKTNYIQEPEEITCTQYTIDILSGEGDAYSGNDRCLRRNSVAESRSATTANIAGAGNLDDDIYVLKHRTDGSHYKVYCNMQHAKASANENGILDNCLSSAGFNSAYRTSTAITCAIGCFTDPDNTNPTADNVGTCLEDVCELTLSTAEKDAYFTCRADITADGNAPKTYNGSTLLCQRNDGHYSFNDIIDIEPNDIVSVQQATENERVSSTPFSLGRTHYSSSVVTIDGIEAAPATFTSGFPYYPNEPGHLKLWDNTLGTLTLMFPYAGAYKLYLFNSSGDLKLEKTLGYTDFEGIGNSFISLELTQEIDVAPRPDANGTMVRNQDDPLNCWDDDWVEIGGGVYGGKHSTLGTPCNEPDDAYSQANAIYAIIVEDLLTGELINVPLVYPIVYLNRVYISKLKLYEHREYCCYEEFPNLP